jgi:glycerophosphoryl diester phosphodiesterase
MQSVSAIAHRGFSKAAPENTMAAYKKAIELGPDFMECDVRRTKDGQLIVIHDKTVDRTTNGKGLVADMTIAELRQLDAGSWFGPEFAGEKLPTLEEALDLSKGKVVLVIEIKEEGTEDRVVEMIKSREMSGEVMICSFHYKVGVRMPALDPQIPFSPIIYIPEPVGPDEAVRLADEAAAVNGSIWAVNYKAINPALVEATHAANMLLESWTVDAEDDIRRMVEMGVDVIGSNDVGLLIKILRQMGAR